MRLRPASAAVLLAGVAAAALLSDSLWAPAAMTGVLLGVAFAAPRTRRWPYLVGALSAGAAVFLVSPLVQSLGWHVLWSGPTLPVLGTLDVTSEELRIAAQNALRLTAVALSFSVYSLLLDHDRLVQAVPFARRSSLVVALATRLVPTLERDAAGYVEALLGRGVAVEGVRARAQLLTPLLTGSLERGLNLAEAMEARGFGRPGATRLPGRPWRAADRAAVALAVALVVAGALWL